MSQLNGSQAPTSAPTSAPPISIVLVDDRADFRQGLQTLLDFYNTTGSLKFRVVGHAASVEQAFQVIQEQNPNLVLLDMELGQGSGLEVLEHLRDSVVPATVLVLSGHREDDWVFKAMQAGARGYVFKDQLSVQLLMAITTVLKDEIYLSPEVATCFFRSFHFHSGHSLTGGASVHLTERERAVLRCLIQGASNEKIASQLNITVGTVKAYLTTIFEKLAVSSRTQAALKALQLGLL
jgi:DNA-binding NarL/FixJ family response regulator